LNQRNLRYQKYGIDLRNLLNQMYLKNQMSLKYLK
jgi:hypothetical protein